MTILESIVATLFVIILISFILLFYCKNELRKKQNIEIGMPIGSMIPNLNYSTYDNNVGSINDIISGSQQTFFFIFSTTCSACNEAIKLIKEKYNKQLNEIKFITFGGEEDIRKWAEKKNITNRVYILKEEEINRILNINAFPYAIIVDNNGNVVNSGPIHEHFIFEYFDSVFVKYQNKNVEERVQ